MSPKEFGLHTHRFICVLGSIVNVFGGDDIYSYSIIYRIFTLLMNKVFVGIQYIMRKLTAHVSISNSLLLPTSLNFMVFL